MAERKRTRKVTFAADDEGDEDERKGREAAQRRCAISFPDDQAHAEQ